MVAPGRVLVMQDRGVYHGQERHLRCDSKPRTLVRVARRADKVWCRRDTRSRLYLVNTHGKRIAKPKTFAEGGATDLDQARPKSFSPNLWWRVLTAA